MLVEITICTVLIALLLWMIKDTLRGIHDTLKAIRDDISNSGDHSQTSRRVQTKFLSTLSDTPVIISTLPVNSNRPFY